MRSRLLLFAAIAAAALGLAACGNSGVDDTPAACLAGAPSFRQALAAAPGEVRLDGSTKISDCLVDGQSGGELADTGSAIILAATQLNEAARNDPGGAETTQLGYLVGAVQEGGSGTSGIHSDLLRRLDAAAQFTPAGATLPASFQKAYAAGYAAGRKDG